MRRRIGVLAVLCHRRGTAAIAIWCMQPPRERWTTMAIATVEGAH